jgi:hypothetical protein
MLIAQPATFSAMDSTPAPVERTVHFSPNVTTLAGGSEALRQRLGHQSDSDDPFIVSGNNATTGSSRMFSTNAQVCFHFLNLIMHVSCTWRTWTMTTCCSA